MMTHLTDGERDILAETAQDAWEAQEERWAEMPADVQDMMLMEDEESRWLGVDESVAYAGYRIDLAGWEEARERMRLATPRPVMTGDYPF